MSNPASEVETSTIHVTYYTDPLCGWSWAMEPHWRRLRYEYGNQLQCQYRMVGLIPRWDRFHDPIHSVSRPAQMAPLWIQISESTGAVLSARLWSDDPPASSLPGCLAVKAAQRQGAWAAEAYLRRLREAAMLDGRNIARRDVLAEIARQAADDLPLDLPFDPQRWTEHVEDPQTSQLLADDLREVRYQAIDRVPAIEFRIANQRPIVCIGYKNFFALQAALRHLQPDIPSRRKLTRDGYASYWGRTTPQELATLMVADEAPRHREFV